MNDGFLQDHAVVRDLRARGRLSLRSPGDLLDAGRCAARSRSGPCPQVRRLIVLNRDKRLVGILSLGDLAVHTADDGLAGEVAEAVSQPAEPER